MGQVLGAFGVLDFTLLPPILAWCAFWNLWTVYFFNFPNYFSGRVKPRMRGPPVLHFSHDEPNRSSLYFPGISDLLSEVSRFQHHTKMGPKCITLLFSSLNLSPNLLVKGVFFFFLFIAALVTAILDLFHVHKSHHLLSCYSNSWNTPHFLVVFDLL